MAAFKNLFLRDVVRLFFPATCCCCNEVLVGSEHDICTQCQLHLPTTEYFNLPGNNVEVRFQGRVDFDAAGSLLFFNHSNPTRTILHDIKYHGNISLAHVMGRQMGMSIAQSHRFDTVDLLVPIPLHRNKQRKRGYNQSEELCKGISQVFCRPISTGNLIRTINTQTQTHKNRYQRLDNMDSVFRVKYPSRFERLHLLLVDDVITTGATIESACQALLPISSLKISIATLAIAGDF